MRDINIQSNSIDRPRNSCGLYMYVPLFPNIRNDCHLTFADRFIHRCLPMDKRRSKHNHNSSLHPHHRASARIHFWKQCLPRPLSRAIILLPHQGTTISPTTTPATHQRHRQSRPHRTACRSGKGEYANAKKPPRLCATSRPKGVDVFDAQQQK